MERSYATQFTNIVSFENSIPYLYRYENSIWIDDFFAKGNIFISSFKNYKKYQDNQLGDKHEGSTMSYVTGNNNQMIGTYTSVGLNEFCFCTSILLDDELKTTFKRDSVFRIKDPLNFMLEITKSLPRAQGVLFGNCLYVNAKIIRANIPGEINMDNMRDDNEPEKISLDKLMAAASPSLTRHRYFLKHTDYQKQAEYRILWSTDRTVEDGIIINCPEAVQFCERV